MNAVFVTSLLQGLFAFALMAAIAMACAAVIKIIVGALARSSQAAPAVAVPVVTATAVATPQPVTAAASIAADASPAETVSDDIAIIIAAACNAAFGAHRIVYLAESNRAANWTTEMRTRHHLSHVPHR
jgi:hypothetical protein